LKLVPKPASESPSGFLAIPLVDISSDCLSLDGGKFSKNFWGSFEIAAGFGVGFTGSSLNAATLSLRGVPERFQKLVFK
jgi:hypothetical protein